MFLCKPSCCRPEPPFFVAPSTLFFVAPSTFFVAQSTFFLSPRAPFFLSPRAYFFCRPEASAEGSPWGRCPERIEECTACARQVKVGGIFLNSPRSGLKINLERKKWRDEDIRELSKDVLNGKLLAILTFLKIIRDRFHYIFPLN